MYFIIIFLAIVTIFFAIREKSILNPIVIFCGIWTISLFLASLGLFDMIQITNRAKIIIGIGVISFVLGAMFVYIFSLTNKENNQQEKKEYVLESINYKLINIALIFGIIITIPVAAKVIVLLAKGTSLGMIRSMYYSYGNAKPLILNDTMFTLFDWGTSVILFVATPLVIVGFMNKKINVTAIVLLIVYTGLYVTATAGRSQLIIAGVELIFAYLINKENISKKVLKTIKGLIFGLAILILIISLARINKESDSVNQGYAYFSLSMPYFSEMVKYCDQEDIRTNGIATFYGPYVFTQKVVKTVTGYKFKLADYYYDVVNKPQNYWVKVFKNSPDNYNAYCTMFYNFYLDFRTFGVFLFSLVYGMLMEIVYLSMKKKKIHSQVIYLITMTALLTCFAKWGFASPTIIIALTGVRMFIRKEKIIIPDSKKIGKTKVLVFGITDLPGGVESVIMNYFRNIDRNKIQFDFLCNTKIVAYEDEIKKLGGNIYRITPRSENAAKFKQDMKEFFEKNKGEYSAIWVNVCSLANIEYLKYARKYGIEKRVIHSHNSQNMDSFVRGILHKINRFFIEDYATDFWSCSNVASKWFYNNRIIKSDKYRIIKNAIDYDRFSFKENICKEYKHKLNVEYKIVVGNIGRLHFQKNQLFLIDVFKELYEIDNRFEMLIVGDGEERQNIVNKINDMNLKEQIQVLGIRPDVADVMQSFDVLLFPSLFEGLPLVLLEAQANGLKIFASDTITKDIKLSENLKFISLNKTPKEWAQIIYDEFKKNGFERVNNYERMLNSGYEIKNEAWKMELFFERN